ncbi:hypothetical protein EWB00_000826 [Schistosoma japonicum]|uniref:Uncharacterized protein n=1 Tax=Schistosoma japonicum TaxID=6182 RepID=A0A4Z2CKU4_SCHJA|nr:hypothetical protein EWB00_000826 [Schistosoma japonicum]
MLDFPFLQVQESALEWLGGLTFWLPLPPGVAEGGFILSRRRSIGREPSHAPCGVEKPLLRIIELMAVASSKVHGKVEGGGRKG